MEDRITALANFLNVERITVNHLRGNEFDCDNEAGEYIVLIDEEADDATAAYIKDSLWAFNASFILEHTKNGYNPKVEVSLQKMQEELCESANDLIDSMLENIEDFISDAIVADGRGHFLSGYDSEENEETVDDVTYYIYRTN